EEYKHIVLVEKKGTEQTDLTIVTYNLDSSYTNFKHFDINTAYLNFSTITYNNETFTDAIRIDAYNEDRSINSTLIYSKTHGIEVIMVEDSAWYESITSEIISIYSHRSDSVEIIAPDYKTTARHGMNE